MHLKREEVEEGVSEGHLSQSAARENRRTSEASALAEMLV